jgi:CheY-like chemotaxis protein
LTVESTVGTGSTFRFTMPAETALSDIFVVPATAEQSAGGGESTPLVLVIENDAAARDLITLHLTEGGYRVRSASTADEAVRLARELRPDAITLDIVLPDRDGLVVLSQLKGDARTRSIPVLVVSVTDRSEIGFSLGASEWLVKPVDRQTLLLVIESTIGAPDASAHRKVLVVDDEPQAREYVREWVSGDRSAAGAPWRASGSHTYSDIEGTHGNGS